MTNIELLNRQELIIFLEQSLKVALFQEHKSKDYVRLLGKFHVEHTKFLRVTVTNWSRLIRKLLQEFIKIEVFAY